MDYKWLTLHIYSGQEHKIKTNLENEIQRMGLGEKIREILVPDEDVDPVEVEINLPPQPIMPNDPMYNQQWAWQNIQAEDGWGISTGSPVIHLNIPFQLYKFVNLLV